MKTLWHAADYLFMRIRARVGPDSERGALSLEWVIIMVAVALAATAAVVLFNKEIGNAVAQLP